MTRTGLARNTWVKWVLWLGLWTALGLAFAGQFYLSQQKGGSPVTWGFALKQAMADWYGFALLSLPALWVGRQFPFAPGRWWSATLVHLPASAVFSLSWMALRAAIYQWQSQGELYRGSFAEAFSRAFLATFFWNLLIYWGVILAQNAFSYYQKYHERELQTAELETRLAQARLQALHMQLNPHFLFNTLNAISSLMHQDVEAADRMIAQLSDLLRYALESTESHQVPLRQELAFLDRYLEIQQARFRDRLELRREIAPETLDASVPNLLLQPLVENAIQHGIAPHARLGRIVLRARRQADRLELEIEDNGDGLVNGSSLEEGVGLSNTRARLEQLYGGAQHLRFDNVPGGGLLVHVSFPWQSDPGTAKSTALPGAGSSLAAS